MRRISTALIVTVVCGVTMLGQGGGPPGAAAGGQAGRGAARGPQGPQVVSPQVNPDRTVMLRLLAPKATEVTVTGEILNGSQPQAMTKGEDGIWTATAGPVPPDVYTYAFSVDGVNTPDPRNPWVKLVSATGLASQVEVPGDGPQYYDSKPGPHGLVADRDLRVESHRRHTAGVGLHAAGLQPDDHEVPRFSICCTAAGISTRAGSRRGARTSSWTICSRRRRQRRCSS